MKCVYNKLKTRVYGVEDIDFLSRLDAYLLNCAPDTSEFDIRLAIQDLIDSTKTKMDVVYDGNRVWPYNTTINAFKRLLKANDTRTMTKHMYSFFNLCTGTIAHTNKFGWSYVYPDNESLKALFKRNEYGNSVDYHVPAWKSDVKRIVKEMNRLLKEV